MPSRLSLCAPQPWRIGSGPPERDLGISVTGRRRDHEQKHRMVRIYLFLAGMPTITTEKDIVVLTELKCVLN